MSSGTAPNTSLVLTDEERDFINKYFDGGKSAAIHKGLELLMKELTAITIATDEAEATNAVDRAIAAIQQLPEEEQDKIARDEFLRFKKFIDERLNN